MKVICWLAALASVAVSGEFMSWLNDVVPDAGLLTTDFSRVIVVSPVAILVGLVTATGGGKFGAGVTGAASVGVEQATLVVVVLQPVVWVLKLSKLLFTQPPSEIVATAKTNPLT